jgi:hypothetical protein
VQFNVRISFAAKIVVASVSETDAALRYEKWILSPPFPPSRLHVEKWIRA